MLRPSHESKYVLLTKVARWTVLVFVVELDSGSYSPLAQPS